MDAALVVVMGHAGPARCVILHQFHVGIGVFRAVEVVCGLRTERVATVQIVTGSAVFPRSSTV